jgi:hypothetical protein
VARTAEAVEALRAKWQQMPSRVEADIDFFLQFIKAHSDFVLRSHVIVLRKREQVIGMLPGRLERRSLRVPVGCRWLALPPLNQLTFVGQLRVSKPLFAPTFKGVSINGLRTPLLAFSQAGKWVLTRLGHFEKARKMWPSRLAVTASVEDAQKARAAEGPEWRLKPSLRTFLTRRSRRAPGPVR